jgi:hypothetical protein
MITESIRGHEYSFGVPVHESRVTSVSNGVKPRAYFETCVGRSDRSAQRHRWLLRSITPKRARRPSNASVDHTEARCAKPWARRCILPDLPRLRRESPRPRGGSLPFFFRLLGTGGWSAWQRRSSSSLSMVSSPSSARSRAISSSRSSAGRLLRAAWPPRWSTTGIGSAGRRTCWRRTGGWRRRPTSGWLWRRG